MPTKAADYDLIGSYDNQRISTISAQRTVNMFEYMDPQGKRPKSLLPTSGLVDVGLDIGNTGGARAAYVFNQAIYQVYGDRVYRTLGTTGSLVTDHIGTLSTSSGYVGIEANTFQVIFVDGEQGFIFDTSTGIFKRITDPSFPAKSIDVTFIDGFFLVAHGTTNQFQLSDFNQGLIWGSDYNPPEPEAFTATSGGSPNLVLTTGSTTGFPVNTPVAFSGTGTLPTGTPAISKNTV